jgi:RecB family exonuclease
MTSGPAIDHLSHSQVSSFTACPRRWHYEKVERAERERLPVALVFGCAIHDTLAEVHAAAVQGDAINLSDRFAHHWQQAITGPTPLAATAEEQADLLARGRALVAAYQPPPGIVGIEEPVRIELAPDLPPIEGRIDLIRVDSAGDLILADLKTSATKQLSDTTAVEAQLGLYDVAFPASRHEAVVLAKGKTPVITVQPLTPWPVERLVQHYREVYAAMRARIRYAVRGWHCQGCAFSDRCRGEC